MPKLLSPKVPLPKYPLAARLPLAAVLLLSASTLALSQNQKAQNQPPQTPAPAALSDQQPVISDDSIDDFGELNKNLINLREKIAHTKDMIARNEDVNIPDNRREAFQATVKELLAAFADGGEVAQFGDTAKTFVQKHLEAAKQDANLPAAQKDAVVIRWQRLKTQTESAAAALDATRKDLTDKLKLLQARGDFLDQMEKLGQSRAVLDAIADLGDQRQAVSDHVRALLTGEASVDSGM
jgi:hypothetical protein